MVKILRVCQLFILGKMGQDNVFDVIIERKKAFIDYKKKKLKTAKLAFFQGS